MELGNLTHRLPNVWCAWCEKHFLSCGSNPVKGLFTEFSASCELVGVAWCMFRESTVHNRCGGSWEPGYCMSPRIVILRFSSTNLYTRTREIRIKPPHRTPISTLEQYDYFLEKNKSYLSLGVSQALHLHFRWCLLVWSKRLPPRPQND